MGLMVPSLRRRGVMSEEYVVSFDQLEMAIVKLEGRIAVQRIRVACLSKASPERPREQQALNSLSGALYKLRTIRDAILVEEPAGFLH
jgi:hypothetical protein